MLYEEATKVSFEIEQKGNTYTIHTNISELFPEDQYRVSILCHNQQIRGDSKWVESRIEDGSITFNCPDGYSLSHIEYAIVYFTEQGTEQIDVFYDFENNEVNHVAVMVDFGDNNNNRIEYQTNDVLQNELSTLMSITIIDEKQQISLRYDLNGKLMFFNKWIRDE